MKASQLDPREQSELDAKRKSQSGKQPYSTEMDDRELEHAHKEGRPALAEPKASRPAEKV
jgi:hypothetical protein